MIVTTFAHTIFCEIDLPVTRSKKPANAWNRFSKNVAQNVIEKVYAIILHELLHEKCIFLATLWIALWIAKLTSLLENGAIKA